MKPEICFTPIDLPSWSRSEIFYYFSKMAPTGYSLTADLEITQMRRILQAAGKKFFPAFLWLATKLLNQQPEFKIAEVNGQLGFYNVLTPLYATFHDEGPLTNSHFFCKVYLPPTKCISVSPIC